MQAIKARQWPNAVRSLSQAAHLAPADTLVWMQLARVHVQSGEPELALPAAQRAYALEPRNALACLLLTECFTQQHRYAEAAEVFASLAADVARDRDFLVAHAVTLLFADRAAESIPLFLRALSMKMDDAPTHYRMGLAFKRMNRENEAAICFRTAIALDKEGEVRAQTLPLLLMASRQACDWQHLEEDTAALLRCIDEAPARIVANIEPFALLAVPAGAQRQRRLGEVYLHERVGNAVPLPRPGARPPGRIRVGYLSNDLYSHATSQLIAELLERRDTGRFEVFLYCHSKHDGSDIQRRIRAASDHYVDVTPMTHTAIAQRMRADAIDIAIDLKGYTQGTRFTLLAERPAAVQVSFLGYPGTTGAKFLDYVIGDPVVTPLDHAAHFSERIAQMPASYQPNDSRRPLPPSPGRAAVGLPDDAVVMCCFNQSYKLSPAMLDLWSRILSDAPRAVLWMLSWNAHGQRNLLQELQKRGIPPSRVFFSPRLPPDEHIARLRCADLFLDTWPCNAHTTASEALWAGVPVLTVPGETFASRVAASLVSACGLPQLACADDDAYVRQAITLANDGPALRALKEHLDDHRLQLPLFDIAAYAESYHRLLERMFERHRAGLPPEHLAAEPAPAALR
ncbi:tetratricopeptide repeat protein [Aquincola sp. MAHUQ-54]|uniref:protein O-GlcNAc transferase n=2 Tax=Aquincola agrisoli TaxID=3119538 RepID=A0AAW9QL56_9BURK